MYAIKLDHLTKEFKKPIRKEGFIGMFKSLFSRKYEVTKAVNDISLEINEGEIVGYIGSNGAGKSTTIKMMCGILTPSSGHVYINNLEPYKKRQVIAQDIGVVFGQKTQLWWDIPLIETFKVLKEVYQISNEEYEERMAFLGKVLEIKDFLSQPVRTLSLGQRMRADLAAAWLHNPKILFLDEPTIGLDILVKDKIREAIKIMNNKYNTTVILTTHDMDDIASLCTRIIMIEKGSIIYDGSIEDIKNKFGDLRTITISYQPSFDELQFDTFDEKVEFVKDDDGEKLHIKFNADEVSLETVIEYVFHNLKAVDMKIKEISLEDVVKSILEENNNKESK